MFEAENEIIRQRLAALQRWKKLGLDPYPSRVRRSYTLKAWRADFARLAKSKKPLWLTGRLTAWREHGNLIFADLADAEARIQLILRADKLRRYLPRIKLLDVGDFVEVKGVALSSQSGEKSLEVESVRLLAKAIRPLPNRWYGLKDVEKRFRHRHLDLLMNETIRERFLLKHKIIQSLRENLLAEGFVEFETPVLQAVPGGALARPFKTYYEAENLDVYLRIAPELYLKRLLVAGFEKVFEFARVFRNEGVSTQHLQDFTILEFYQAYADYRALMKLTVKLVREAVKLVTPSLKINVGGVIINFRPPWPVKTLRDLILKHSKIDIDRCETASALGEAIFKKGIKLTYQGKAGRGKLIDELYKEMVRPKLKNPTFVIDYPVELSPLAKRQADDFKKVERFQLVVGGWEIVNAFSELNDPLDQKVRFEEQRKLKREGESEAHPYDWEYLQVLEYGMPPAAGWGMGIERFTALLTGTDSIREAVTFPFVKPKA